VQVVVLLCSLSQSRGKQARVWVGLDCQNQLCVERENTVQEEFRDFIIDFRSLLDQFLALLIC